MSVIVKSKYTSFPIIFSLIAIVSFTVVALRSYYVPFNHDEVATFFFYIQSGKYMPFYSHVDANNHVLNSLLGNICFHVFGSSPFSLRLPNLLGLLILIIATYKLTKYFQHIGSKLILTAMLLMSFHWITFFSACRGYGLSMALLMFGVAYMLDYMRNLDRIKLLLFSLISFQLAISSNLILIIVVLVFSGVVLLIQLTNKKIFSTVNVVMWLVHFALIIYWLKFSFFLQDSGALYYGEGDSYWKVTFVSLIQLLLGVYNPIIKWITLIGVVFLSVLCLFLNKQNIKNIKMQIKHPDFSILIGTILFALVLGFYLMNKLLGVNFPEDRTGLFFYALFALWVVLLIDKIPLNLNKALGYGVLVLFTVHFVVNLNFRKHSLSVYETIPEHFFTTLLKEQQKSSERITIGGHRVRELFWGFWNYRNGAVLNPADPTEVMQMNCDYYIATKLEEKYYKDYYDVIDSEPDWGFVVLKRKEKINKTKVLELNNVEFKDNSSEFIDVFKRADTSFTNQKPIIAEFNFDINKIAIPTNTWLVFSINDSTDNQLFFKRYPLQWIGFDLNGKKNLSYSLISGNLPPKAKSLACFIWNIDKQPISIKFNSFKLYQIEGKGVNYVAPDIK